MDELEAVRSSHVNRLAAEKSPYLLQHAHNPVAWFPWGQEAFEKARGEDRPIFLSIGYSTCHWCHVMERESFENEEVARFLNAHFISIKVDREERPDIDGIYMKALTQILRQPGGWPMSMWLTPDLHPFFGGTYFPPEDRWGRPGFRSVLERVADAWRDRRSEILQDAETVAGLLREEGIRKRGGSPSPDAIDRMIRLCARAWDRQYGGMQGAPKFPQPPLALFLLRQSNCDAEAREMVESQLDHMAAGGIYDHLGGGFARYSTDERWLVPHFEKMLYDNALLLRLYAESYLLTGKARYAEVASQTARYLLRDMRTPEGAIFAAEDADSEGQEGKFYAWRRDEVNSLLGAREAEVFGLAYDVSEDGNWMDAHTETRGLNVLNRRLEVGQIAKMQGMDVADVESILGRARAALFRVRCLRPRPLRDDKVLTSWNGLAISGLAIAGRALRDADLVTAAAGVASFARDRLYRNGRLYHRFCDGDARFDGNLDDYAFLTQGLIDLYETCFDAGWLLLALELNTRCLELFRDADSGGFFFTPPGRADLIARSMEMSDGAEPSGYSVATLNLVRLAEMTGSAELRDRAREAIEACGALLAEYPLGCPGLLLALDHLRGPSRQIVLAGDPNAEETRAMIREIHSRALPRTVILLASDRLEESAFPAVQGKTALQGRPTAYICADFTCREPVRTAEDLAKLLDSEINAGRRS